MFNEMRNELLGILSYVKYGDDWRLNDLLDRFEIDIKDKLKDLEYEKQRLEENLRTLEYVREEIKKEGK